MTVSAKDRGLACRIAGNVGGTLLANTVERCKGYSDLERQELEAIAPICVGIAMRIIQEVDREIADEAG